MQLTIFESRNKSKDDSGSTQLTYLADQAVVPTLFLQKLLASINFPFSSMQIPAPFMDHPDMALDYFFTPAGAKLFSDKQREEADFSFGFTSNFLKKHSTILTEEELLIRKYDHVAANWNYFLADVMQLFTKPRMAPRDELLILFFTFYNNLDNWYEFKQRFVTGEPPEFTLKNLRHIYFESQEEATKWL